MSGNSYQVVVGGFCCLDHQTEIVTYDFTLSEREVKAEGILNQFATSNPHLTNSASPGSKGFSEQPSSLGTETLQ